jgi:hypothetical protein
MFMDSEAAVKNPLSMFLRETCKNALDCLVIGWEDFGRCFFNLTPATNVFEKTWLLEALRYLG